MTARIAISWQPEVFGKSAHSEKTFYAHYEFGQLKCFEIRGVIFSVHQVRAIIEDIEWPWELFLRRLREEAEDQRAPFDFGLGEVRCG